MNEINRGGMQVCPHCGRRDCGYTKGLKPVGVIPNKWGNLDVMVAPNGDEHQFGTCCAAAARDAGFSPPNNKQTTKGKK